MSDKASGHRVAVDVWPNIERLRVRVTFGASGAITNWRGYGITSVTHGTTGITTFTLPRGYAGGNVGFQVCREGAASTAHLFPILTTDNTDSTTQAPTLSVTLTGETGTATDPTSGDVYTFIFDQDEVGLPPTVTP